MIQSTQNRIAEICIREISVNCILGVGDMERKKKQTILVTLTFVIDVTRAALTDDISQTVNYHTVADKVVAMVSTSRFHLLESLGEAILNLCLKEEGMLSVTVRIEKPHILPYAKGVYLEMTKNNAK